MKKLLVITPHSFVDLITNSSTELFVCDTKKTVAMVTELLKTLLKQHDAIMAADDPQYKPHAFDSVFKTPTVSKFGFEWWNVPSDIRKDYDYYHTHNLFGRNPYAPYSYGDGNIEHKALENREREIVKEFNVHEKDLDERDKVEYDRRWKAYREAEDVLWSDYGSRTLRSELNLFLDFLRQNEFTPEQIAAARVACDAAVQYHLDTKKGKYAYLSDVTFSEALAEAYEVFHELESWGITTKKGSIFVYSESDNTIPYKLMDTITSYLNANRYHLG